MKKIKHILSKSPSFEVTKHSPIMEVGIALMAHQGEEFVPGGSGVIIGKNIAITAKHNIEYYWREFDYRKNFIPGTDCKGTFSLQAISFTDNASQALLWDITYLAIAPNTDIAYLHLIPRNKLASEYKWEMLPSIEFEPPELNERLSCFGYHSSKVKLTNNTVNWSHTPTTAIGIAKEIHGNFRDKGTLNFPCFRTNARFDAGMSGGPIFNNKGRLCGIVCYNLPPENEEEEHVSYGTLLWPSMSTKLKIPRMNHPNDKPYRAIELAKYGYISSHNWQSIEIIENIEDGTETVKYYRKNATQSSRRLRQ